MMIACVKRFINRVNMYKYVERVGDVICKQGGICGGRDFSLVNNVVCKRDVESKLINQPTLV